MQDSLFLDICRNDYKAVLQMVREAIELCPEELWDERTDEPPFWQQVYHTIFYIDFYLGDELKDPRVDKFIEGEASNLDHKPSTTPSRDQIKGYLEEVSERCEAALNGFTLEKLEGENKFHWTGPTPAHRLIYNIRHAQHHVGWLNSMLARKTGKSAGWVITPNIS
jgi:hypothetical protein